MNAIQGEIMNMKKSGSFVVWSFALSFAVLAAPPGSAAQAPQRVQPPAGAKTAPKVTPPAAGVVVRKPNQHPTTNSEWHVEKAPDLAGGGWRATDGTNTTNSFPDEKSAAKAAKVLTKATTEKGNKGGKGGKGGDKGNGVRDDGSGNCGPDSTTLC